ncbi:MAG: hypothetical protein PWK00_01120, partial [Coxiella burnetii]|nr:hypothetical protein [Coxiella burnetii]
MISATIAFFCSRFKATVSFSRYYYKEIALAISTVSVTTCSVTTVCVSSTPRCAFKPSGTHGLRRLTSMTSTAKSFLSSSPPV